MSITSSTAVRDPLADHLLTPQTAALAVIDYQPSQFAAVRSMDQDLLLRNIASTVKLAKLFGVPVVHSTINVAGGSGPTVPGLADLLEDDSAIDRTTMNAWEHAADAIAGTSVDAHRAGLERFIQAGGRAISWVALAGELQRDWARAETVEGLRQIVLTERLLQE
jgi:nicotinamidase-related amidase